MHAFENHNQWNAVKEVAEKLWEGGFCAYLAGGSVRDFLMGRSPHDFDVATDARPDQIEALFPRSIAVGKAFGVIILPFDGFQIEVATFREDLDYKDGRRPEGVLFSTPEADARRRDFTVNALFYDLRKDEILDYVGGREDLARKQLRAVGDPNKRFDEDKLRILRAVRFSAQLEFEVEDKTLKAVSSRANDVTIVSRERIRDELLKLLKCPARANGLRLLWSTGVGPALFPKLASKVQLNDWIVRFERAEASDLTVALALFFEPLFGSEDLRQFRDDLKAMKFETKQIDLIQFALTSAAVFRRAADPARPVRKGDLVKLLAHEGAPVAEALARIDAGTDLSWSEVLIRLRSEVLVEGRLPKPFLTGRELSQIGLKPGPQMGSLLNEVYLLQLEGEFPGADEADSRRAALDWIQARINLQNDAK